MHAIRLHEFGPAGNLRFEEVDDPVAGEGQVRIAVEAAGVHLIDTTIRRGQAGGPFPLPDLPMTPGREVAGVVDRVGDHVDPSWLGGRVVAHLGMASGGYAELAVAPVASLHALPDGLAADVAVACIGTGRTALAVLDVAQLTADDVVLIPAAAGGLGSLFVQAALIAGAVSVGLAGGAEKAASVHEAGADHAVDYLQPDWTAQLETALEDRRATVVLDGVGGEIGHALMKRLAPGGRVVLVGWSSGTPTAITTQDIVGGGLTVSAAVGPRLLNRPGGLREFETRALAEAAAERLVPAVHDRFPLRDAAAAHLALESRDARQGRADPVVDTSPLAVRTWIRHDGAVRGVVRPVFEGAYVVAVGLLTAVATRDPNEFRPSLWVAALALCLPAMIVVLPALYLVAAAAWNATGADHGGIAWPVTATYVLVLCIAALLNVVLLRRVTARTRRHALATAQRNT